MPEASEQLKQRPIPRLTIVGGILVAVGTGIWLTGLVHPLLPEDAQRKVWLLSNSTGLFLMQLPRALDGWRAREMDGMALAGLAGGILGLMLADLIPDPTFRHVAYGVLIGFAIAFVLALNWLLGEARRQGIPVRRPQPPRGWLSRRPP